ncbi:carbon storage regulator [Xanthomonas sacchari]|uniref:carbon storage regulator n=1 Tax=Xanthomonas sacchari TaxID=56458 RepID=UPI002781CFE1|nr:carbon storage regulator [Xanthomonas sacchari]MDQ1090666.1 carbon storage regulator [Xanthomonas sacchari]
MLILTRRECESIVIADTIFVTVRKIRPARASLQISGVGADATGTYDLRVGAHLQICEHVTVTVHAIADRKVKLDIVAPRAISVHREEVAERIRAEMELQGYLARLRLPLGVSA